MQYINTVDLQFNNPHMTLTNRMLNQMIVKSKIVNVAYFNEFENMYHSIVIKAIDLKYKNIFVVFYFNF